MDCCLRRFGEGVVSIPTVVESIFVQKLIIEGRTRTGRKALGLVLALAVEQGVDKWKTVVRKNRGYGSITRVDITIACEKISLHHHHS